MSEKRKRRSDDDPTELTEMDVHKVAGVTRPANGTPFILLKSRPSTPSSAEMVRSLAAGRLPSAEKKTPSSRIVSRAGDNVAAKQRAERERREAAERARRRARKAAKRARKAAARASLERAVKAAWMTADTQRHSEIPATNCVGEAASILAAVTNERSDGKCNAKTLLGLPCQRPAARGARCHLHA
jgi:hypothetical protein